MGKRRGLGATTLASINALAVATIAAAGGSAEAAIIYHPTLGFPSSLPLPGGNSISLFKTHTSQLYTNTLNNGTRRGFFVLKTQSTQARARGVEFRVAGSTTRGHALVAVTKKGRTFNMVGTGINSSPALAARLYKRTSTAGTRRFIAPSGQGVTRPLTGISGFSNFVQHSLGRSHGTYNGQNVTFIKFSAYKQSTTSSPANYSREYALFSFDVGSLTDYGWLELSVNGLNVDVLGYAYDNTGKPIKAGAVPEPQHLPLVLGALAFGAIGVRELRKRRNAAG